MSKLKIYRASAGAGKTFALTMEYFKIVFASPLEYKNVLAVTFTNKATEEMKSRIIRELNKLAEGEKSDYNEALKSNLRLSDEQVKERAIVLRTLILHDYGRLSVTTIDRFFQRIIKAFTKELGIFPGYNVELDSDYVLLRAVDQIMQRMNEDKELRVWITELMNNSVEEAKSWSVKGKIAELGKELFGENYMLFDKAVQQKFGNRDFLKAYQSFLRGIVKRFEKRLEEYGKRACHLIETNNLRVEDFKNGKRGVVNYFYKLRDKNLNGITDSTRNALDNPDAWIAKKQHPEIRTQIENLYPTLNSWLGESIQFYDEEVVDYHSARLLLDNLYQLGILNDLYREIRAYCEEKGLMLLSDTTRILNVLIAANDTSFLFEKIGNFYKHVMIDEFQDTSAMQWSNFRPLIVNTLSEGGKALVVGDVKQSIYRWRNGDWRLLSSGVEKDFKTFGICDEILEHNWRSAGEIVMFNNLLFSQAALQLKEMYDKEEGKNDYSFSILEAYAHTEQKIRRDERGYIQIKYGGDKQEEGSAEAIMEAVVGVIRNSMGRGEELKNSVILVRNGKEGAFVADYIIEYNRLHPAAPIPFISNDSLYVAASPYVVLIISVLKYIMTPYDLVNRAVLSYHYFTYVRNENWDDQDTRFKAVASEETFMTSLGIPFLQEINRETTGSLYEMVEAIIAAMKLRDRVDELPYLIAFQDIIFEYEENNASSIPVFLEWWEKEKDKKVLSTSEETNSVRILTIHKSKGLEFDTVIIPFCNWDLDDMRHARRLWCDNKEEGFKDLEYAPLNYSSKLSDSHFKEAYLEEHMKTYIDNLNLLYVALTRAKRALHVFPYAPKISKEGRPADIGSFLYQVLERLESTRLLSGWNSGEKQLSIGEYGILKEGRKETVDNRITLKEYPVFDLKDRVRVRYKYEDYTDIEEKGNSAVDEGKLFHELFCRIEKTTDIERAVNEVYRTGLIHYNEKEMYRKKLVDYLDNVPVASWFDGSYRVITERDILFTNAGRARPDRVMFDGNKVVIVDYKFGYKEEEEYSKQMGFYCKILRQMGYKEVKGYIWYVNMNKIYPVGSGTQLQLDF